LKNIKKIINKKIRHRQDLFYIICKFTRIKFLDRDFNKIYKNYARKNLIKKIRNIKGKKIFLIGTPEYGNLGDHAIALATKKFLSENFSDFKIIEITSGDYHYGKNTVKPAIQEVLTRNDIILLSGGGFLGSLWVNHYGEEMVRDVLTSFKESKIVILPQTVFFEDNKYGKEQYLISKKIYEGHPNLVICAREKKSYQFLKNNFTSIKTFLIPDMVFYLKEKNIVKGRKGAILCLRNDKEKVSKVSKDILENVYHDYSKVQKLDTVINKSISTRKREKLVKKMLNKFRKSEFVVSDRLHGMLFAYITNTPFFALDNLSSKIKSTFESWIIEGNTEMKIEKYESNMNYTKEWNKLIKIIKGR